VPDIPSAIDLVWIVHLWMQGYVSSPVCVARRGDTGWRFYEAAT
jgi:hypothetical protein